MAAKKHHGKVKATDGLTDWTMKPYVRLDIVPDSGGKAMHLYVHKSHPLASVKAGTKVKVVVDDGQ